ncbi:MAG: hypothetical protein H0X66_03320 [Verrucomicrobia bacterium]|nr:hypothetical protein [Verrucomicrobiota bacterium]
MKFSAEYREGLPYRGAVPDRGASDYFWVTDYRDGRTVERRHFSVRDGKPEFMFRDTALVPEKTETGSNRAEVAEALFRGAVDLTGDEYLKAESELLAGGEAVNKVLLDNLTSTNVIARSIARNLLAMRTGLLPENLRALQILDEVAHRGEITILGHAEPSHISQRLIGAVGPRVAEFLALRLVKQTIPDHQNNNRGIGALRYIDDTKDPKALELLRYGNGNPLRVKVKLSKQRVREGEPFQATMRVENTSETQQEIRVMNCHWDYNWRSTLRRNIGWRPWTCDKNFEEEISIPPGGGYQKELELVAYLAGVETLYNHPYITFRMGFTQEGGKTTLWSDAQTVTILTEP